MTKTLTLAHISDLHLTAIDGFHPRYWNVKRGLGYLNWRRGRRFVHLHELASALVADAHAQGASHFAVTGDLANIGLPAEYGAALAWLGTLGPPDHVSVVPGNHDIYTGRMHGASCLESWAPYMTSDAQGQAFAPPAADGAFPYVRRAGPVALIGVNSAQPRAPFVAAGRIGGDQLDRLARVLARTGAAGLIRVVMIHHPPLPGQAPRLRGLDDAAGFEAVVARHGAELVLHGHNHRDMLAWAGSGPARVPVAGVATGSAARWHKGEPLARYKLFHIEGPVNACRIEMVTRGLAEPGGAIAELDRRTLSRGVAE